MKIRFFSAARDRITMLTHVSLRNPMLDAEKINMKYGGNGYRSIYEQRKEAAKARNAYIKTYMTPHGRRGK